MIFVHDNIENRASVLLGFGYVSLNQEVFTVMETSFMESMGYMDAN